MTLEAEGWSLQFYWGQIHELGTPAYWMEQTRQRGTPPSYALGDSLAEEVTACLLGGHGIPADIGLAAYHAVRSAGMIDTAANAEEYEAVLSAPLAVPGRARAVRYRFARQRAERLAGSLLLLEARTPPREPLALRSWLTELPGIGPKTASWIVRNRFACDHVAIIDVHVHRAGIAGSSHRPGDYPGTTRRSSSPSAV